MSRELFALRRVVQRLFRYRKRVVVWTCKFCGQDAVLYVNERGHVCMNCGESQ